MRDKKRCIAGLLVIILMMQSFCSVDFNLFKVYAAYADEGISSEQNLSNVQSAESLQEGETQLDAGVNGKTIQSGESTQTGELALANETMQDVEAVSVTTDSAINTELPADVQNNSILADSDGTIGTIKINPLGLQQMDGTCSGNQETAFNVEYTTPSAVSVPQNVGVEAYNGTLLIYWQDTDGAESYEVSFDGNITSTTMLNSYYYNLEPNSRHTIKVRAVNTYGSSEWSPEIVKYTLLAVPLNLAVTTASSISVGLAWDAVSGATGYEIYRNNLLIGTTLSNSYTDNGVSADLTYKYKVKAYNDTGNVSTFSNPCSIITASTPPSAPDYIDAMVCDISMMVIWSSIPAATCYDVSFDGNITRTSVPYCSFYDLEPNSQHVIKVRAVNGVGSSDWSTEITKITSLSVPSNFEAVPSNISVSLVWDLVYGAEYYEIYRGDLLISTSDTNTYIDSGLTENTEYSYKVKAFNARNVSDFSEAITVTTLSAPAVPSNIFAEAACEKITVRWDSVADAESYDISLDGSVINVNSSTYTYEDLEPNTLYTFKVRTVNAEGIGEWSDERSVYTLLSTPINLVAVTVSAISVDLTWDAVQGATGYDVFRDGVKITSTGTNAYTDTGLTPNTSYTYSVKAYNTYNVSAQSDSIEVNTIVTIPVNIHINTTDTTLTVSWNAVEGAISYDISLNNSITNVTTTNYTYSELEPDSLYTVKVRAVRAEGVCMWSSENLKYTLLSAPANLVKTYSTSRTVGLMWDVVSGATGYEIYRNSKLIWITDGVCYTDALLTGNTIYTYYVKAYNDHNISALSNQCTVKTDIEIPKGINVITTDSTITVSWDAAEGANGYDVSLDDNIIANTETINYTFYNLEPSTLHTVKVRTVDSDKYGLIGDLNGDIAVNALDYSLMKKYLIDNSFDFPVENDIWAGDLDGDGYINGLDNALLIQYLYGNITNFPKSLSAWSEETEKYTLLPTPANFEVIKILGTSADLTFDTVAGATGYEIYRNEEYIRGFISNSSESISFTEYGLHPTEIYEYKVKAYNDVTESDFNTVIVPTLDDDYGDDMYNAFPVYLENDVHGIINFSGDVDFFKFTPTINGNYRIKSISDIDTYGLLYNSTGLIDANNDGIGKDFLLERYLIADNTYYISVEHRTGGTGEYILNISPQKPDIIVTAINPSNAYPGQPVQFTVTVKNQGLAATPAGTVHRVGIRINGGDTVLWSDNYTSSIAPGATANLSVSGGIEGITTYTFNELATYQITAEVDDTNLINESDETNNALTKSLIIDKPDLVVTDITWTNSINYKGQPIIFSAVVKNQGQSSTILDKPFRVGFKANGGDITVWTADYTQAIAPGGTVKLVAAAGVNGASFIFTTPGAIQLTAYADDNNRLEETNENNNTYNKSITIYEPSDLIISDISYSPQNPSTGENITFSAKITNIGLGDTQGGVRHRVGFKIDEGSTVIWSDSYTASIKAGESVTVSATGGIAGSVWKGIEGTHNITAIVDDLNTIFEGNEQNNTYTERMVVLPPCDLVITKILLSPANPIAGEPVTISATIKNIGQNISPAGRIHRVGFKIDGGTTSIWADDYDWSITAGASITVTATSGTDSAVWNAISGGHTVTAIVDDIGLINETDEANNTLTKNVTVTEKRIFDPNADYDEDGIIYAQELILGTGLENPDTDGDKLTDGDELNIYGTNPLSPDTDGDGIYDETEIKISSDPLTGNENLPAVRQTETLNQNITVTVNGDSNVLAAPFQVVESDNILLNSLSGIVGKPAEISLGGYAMTSADITFKYNEDELQGTSPEDLTVFWVDNENGILVPLSEDKVTIDSTNHTVTGEVNHFSTYILGHKDMQVDLANVDIVFVIDQSGSMSSSDPNYYRLKAVKRFVQDIDILKNRIGIVAFESSAIVKQLLTNDKALLNSTLDSMRYDGGGTNILDGLVKLEAAFGTDNTNTKVIVLLTDGEDSNSDSTNLDKARYLSTSKKIMVNTVALGAYADVSLLQGMAGVGNGGFFYINNQNGLTQQQIDAQIELLYVKLVKLLTLTKNNKYNFNPQQKMAIDYADKYLGVDYAEAVRLYTQANANMLTGNYLEQAEDLAIDAPGPGLKLERTYNSAAKDVTTIGRGWRLNYDSNLRVMEGANAVSGKVTANSLNVRSYPYGAILTTLGKGKEVTYITKNAERDSDGKYWHLVQLQDGVTGYVASWYISDINGVEVTYGSGTKILFDKKDSNGNYITPYGTFDKLTRNTSTGIYTLVRKDKTQYKYEGSGKLISIEDKNENILNITYTGAKISKVTDQAGRSLTFTYPDNNHVIVTDPANRYVEYVLDSNKNLVSIFDPSRHKTQYTYYNGTKNGSSWSRLEKVIDAVGNQVVKNDYDEFGRLVRQYDANNYVKYHIYRDVYKNEKTGEYETDKNEIVELSDSYINERGFESKVIYNLAEKRPITEEDSESKKTSHRYFIKYNNIWTETTNLSDTDKFYEDNWQAIENGNWPTREEITDRNGNTTIYEKDNRGNIVKITNPDGSNQVFDFIDDNLVHKTDEENKSTYYIYDANGINLEKQAQPLNGSDEYIVSADQTKFAVTAFEYYTDSEASNLGYNYKGLLKSVTDPELNKTTYEYNSYGKAETVTHADSTAERPVKTTYSYNNLGWQKYEITPEGNKTAFAQNQNGKVVRITQNADAAVENRAISRISYDELGRKTKEISANQYDSSLENPTTYGYDGDHGYRYTYYDDGRVHTVKDPENNEAAYTYDPCGNVDTEVKPNGSVYKYEYDSLNRLTKIYFKETAASSPVLLEENIYTILTNKNTQTTNKKYLNDTEVAITISVYDYAGRLISQTNPDGTTISTAYNVNGTINNTTDAKGSKTYYKYDGLNRLTEQWKPFENVSGTVKYTYQKIVYDKAGKKLQETIGKATVAKDGVPTGYIAKNYEYYANGWVKTVTQRDEAGTVFGKTEYEYDDDGNISKEAVYTDAQNKNITEYTYNYMGKVSEKKVHVKAGDIEGNSFASTEDKVLSTLYTYDKNGNLETITTPDGVTTTYTYDNMNRQTSVSQPGIDEYVLPVTITSSTEYDWQGNTVKTTDAKGNETIYTYNNKGLLEKTATETTDATGVVTANTTAFYYDRVGRLTAEVAAKDYDPAKTLDQMNRVEYTYDLMGRVKTKTYKGEEKRVDTTTFGWTTQQVAIVQKAYKYDANGNVIKELDALGFEAATDKTSIDTQINTGYGTEYTYNLANKQDTVLYAETKAKGFTSTIKYSYDALGRTITEINSKGAITKYNYDGVGNVVSVAVNILEDTSDQIIKTSTYDFTGKLLTETSIQSATTGSTTKYEYNALGQVRKAVYPSDTSIPENTVNYQYDVLGRLKTQQDTKGAIDTYTYNNQGDVLSHTQKKQDNTEAITTSTRYDKNGNARFVFDGNGKQITYTYNEQNKVITSRKSASGIAHETTYTYDANGNQIAVTDWRGNTTINVYDSLNRLIETKDAYGKSVQKLEYNHSNVQEKSYDALNKATVYTYDKNNRLLGTTDPENNTTSQTYNSIGNLTTKTDGRGNITTYYYDEFNRLETVVNAKNETTDYTYDLSGNLLTQKDGKGNTTTYEYNVANKVLRRIDQGGRTGSDGNYTYEPAKTETYTYNADGSLASKTDRNGKTTVYIYDIHGRLQSQAIQSTTGSAISFTYDGNGNQLTMTDSTGTTTRTYDELGRVLTKTVPNIGTTTFQYDIISGMDEGCYKEITTDLKGNVTIKVFDKEGRLKTVTADGKNTTYSYYDNGARQSVTYNDGTKDIAIEEYTYYENGLLWTLTNKKADGTVIDSYVYDYDAANNQITKMDSKGITSYTYDELNRLETVTEPDGTVASTSTMTTAYTFDGTGNRKTQTITKGTEITVNTYNYNEQNRLTQIITTVNGTLTATTEYTYDDNGNQLTTTVNGAITVVNVYDYWNQLIQTMTGTATTINAYNGEGYRVAKTVNGTLTRYLYEGDKVVLELDYSGNEAARNVYGSDLIMREAIRTNGSNIFDSYFYLYNGHADVTALLKPDGTIAATYYYDAFGNITDTGSANNSITFAGYQYDAETGLYYLNARMYDPKTARFLQEDTYLGNANDPLSLNLYTYCHNEPLMYYDPDGHHWKYLWIDDLINKFAGTHIGEDSTERTLITPEAQSIEHSLGLLKKEAEKKGDKKVIEVCDKKINDLYKYGSAETIVEKHLKYAPVAAVPAAVSGIVVAPEALTFAMPALTKVSTTPIGNYVLNNGDKLINKGNTAMWGVQTGNDIATGNFNSVPMDILGTFESFMFGKQFSTANGAPLWSKNTRQQNIGKNAVQKGYLDAIQGVNRGTSGVSGAKNWNGQTVKIPEGHVMSPRDPSFTEPPIYIEGPFTSAQKDAFLKGNSAGTKLAPHHRHQIPVRDGGIIDEIPGPGHPEGNLHTGGTPSRHPGESIFNSEQGGNVLRQNEIKDFWKAKGGRLVEVEPGVWIDPGPGGFK